MHYRACVISRDMDFAQFVRLTLLQKVRPVTIADSDNIPTADIYIIDLDTREMPQGLEGKILLCSTTRTRPADCPHLWADRPFRPARLLALLDLAEEPKTSTLLPYPDRPCVLVGEEEVALSAREHALLMALWEANGAFLTREELLTRVWSDEETDLGVVNVYIHYLRKKIETDGRRYIYAARGRGYQLKRGDEGC